MTKYREILRLKSLGFSERNIAHSCGVSRNTVAKVVKRAVEMNLSWPLDHDMTDSVLEEMLFPKVKLRLTSAPHSSLKTVYPLKESIWCFPSRSAMPGISS